ncbi:flagellar biosynthesis protein FlhF [Duganella sp. BJB488]|uniref:flagellar biosynthesis protein FlhF n=1 Tax=unclassified Duganella TaxID=2636909 RepID=UPI000E349562|nr:MULTISPECIES: flagellar biosynthesis protein FlhF [unclassified Duganella]RFP25908.1 flagellar biosynthesis protein FlhF [Duganella sp. BJB489]RFP28351.1 flagellar biosynthesis protein FlhF [Duganella sp. BJB488]RFP36838.1 flagellar biosynthesis protein FlhF [Duganella sp. BJB480]
MNVKKFTAPTSREALRKVRESLGPDAVILSNRQADGGVEILALANDDAASLAMPAPHSPMADPAPSLDLTTAVPYGRAEQRQEPRLEQRMEPRFESPTVTPAPAALPAQPVRRVVASNSSFASATKAAAAVPAPAPARATIDAEQIAALVSAAVASAKQNAAAEMQGMMSEIRAMRGMMETQLAEISWGTTQAREPQKAAVLREMLAAGFSASLARYLIEKLPANRDAADSLRWIKNVLTRNLQTMANEDALIEQGGVFALVGPTGVGKTTSTAKLAARCVMRHGPDKLALITTDAYRIGAHEQLRIYGKILGVMVHSVKDEADLRIALKELKNKHTVLIDTVGVSQRDQMVTEQVSMLQGAGSDVKRLLCLNATATQETLNEVVRAYQGSGLAGCIMTKLDEAAAIGNVLDVVIRQKLNLFYVSNGQRVPEDLHLADPAYLIDRAFKLKRDVVNTQYLDAELPLLMSNGQNEQALREVHLG